jgi:hypothetical protein
MSHLSAYGVKIVLPFLLRGIDDQGGNWRAKCNNIWALGNMAFCSPKQLSSCLPQIVPKLSQALGDTNPKIRDSATESLTLIGSSIKNPEISEVVDILIESLSDPFQRNRKGLEVLLKTKFEHYIDYALKQKRESNAKVDACQVVGSMSELIKDRLDIVPYMAILADGLQAALGDAMSEIRMFAAKAIGKLAQKIGQQHAEHFFAFVF